MFDVRDSHKTLGVGIFAGSGAETDALTSFLNYDFSRNETLIGSADNIKWGITCALEEKDATNTCVINSGATEKSDKYLGDNYTYKESKVYTRLSADEKLDVTNMAKLDVRLVITTSVWPVTSVGVLGLSPNGDIAKYVRAMYTTDTSLLFGYLARNPKAASLDLLFQGHVVVNPAFADDMVAATSTVAAGINFWVLTSDIALPGTDVNYTGAAVCLNSNAPYMLAMPNKDVQCSKVLGLVCNGKTGNDCTSDIADMTKGPTLTLKIGDKSLSIPPDWYLYSDVNKVMQCKFGDSAEPVITDSCPDNTTVAVGREFYYYFSPILKFVKDGSSTITLLTKYAFNPADAYPPGPVPPKPDPPGPDPSPDNKSGMKPILIILIVIAIIGGCGAAYYFIAKRNANRGDGVYRDL